MKKIIIALLTVTLLSDYTYLSDRTLKEERNNHITVLDKEVTSNIETIVPPDGVNLELVQYTSDIGELDAYISTNPNDGKKHPLVIWVTGGWDNSISEFVWEYNSWDNDQSGAFLREKGILVMYPSFRGGNTNPGFKETIYGEVNDVFSAYDYAKSLDYVDPDRIYLIGHSTGGTNALLASAYDDVFRGVFALGPVGNIMNHNQENFTFDITDKYEAKLRSPINWLHNINTPTFIIEGEKGNAQHLRQLEKVDKNDLTEYFIIEGADHFDYLSATTILIGDEILKDALDGSGISITSEKLAQAYNSEPTTLYPTLATRQIGDTNVSIDVPAYWYMDSGDGYNVMYDNNKYNENSFWNTSEAMIIFEEIREGDNLEEFYVTYLEESDEEYYEENINGINAYVQVYEETRDNKTIYYKTILFDNEDYVFEITLYYEGDELEKANVLIESMYNSIKINS